MKILNEFLKKNDIKPEKFEKHVFIRPETGTIEIVLEDVSCYHEWIKDEGADISIMRANDDRRVVGAILPLRSWNGVFKQFIGE